MHIVHSIARSEVMPEAKSSLGGLSRVRKRECRQSVGPAVSILQLFCVPGAPARNPLGPPSQGLPDMPPKTVFTAFLGLGLIFSLIMTIPFLVLLSFMYLVLWAFTSSTAVASGAAILAFLGWELFAMSHFAVVRIQIGADGMTTDWRRFAQRTFAPWGHAAKLRHIRGPLFLLESPGKMAFLTWMIVSRAREFRSELAAHSMLIDKQRVDKKTGRQEDLVSLARRVDKKTGRQEDLVSLARRVDKKTGRQEDLVSLARRVDKKTGRQEDLVSLARSRLAHPPKPQDESEALEVARWAVAQLLGFPRGRFADKAREETARLVARMLMEDEL
jgi:hypothetical protein